MWKQKQEGGRTPGIWKGSRVQSSEQSWKGLATPKRVSGRLGGRQALGIGLALAVSQTIPEPRQPPVPLSGKGQDNRE